jgi:L-glutamine-phosphate cytidylyltransferase
VTYDPNWIRIWGTRFADPLSDAETFKLNDDHSLAEIGLKPKVIEEVQGQYMGLLRFTPLGWSEILRIRRSMPLLDAERMHMTGTLQRVVEAGEIAVKAVPYTGVWGEIDSEEDLKAYE